MICMLCLVQFKVVKWILLSLDSDIVPCLCKVPLSEPPLFSDRLNMIERDTSLTSELGVSGSSEALSSFRENDSF